MRVPAHLASDVDQTSVRGWVALGNVEAERGKAKAALTAWSRVPAIDRAFSAAGPEHRFVTGVSSGKSAASPMISATASAPF